MTTCSLQKFDLCGSHNITLCSAGYTPNSCQLILRAGDRLGIGLPVTILSATWTLLYLVCLGHPISVSGGPLLWGTTQSRTLWERDKQSFQALSSVTGNQKALQWILCTLYKVSSLGIHSTSTACTRPSMHITRSIIFIRVIRTLRKNFQF